VSLCLTKQAELNHSTAYRLWYLGVDRRIESSGI
jgi:hypothetical protein